MSSLPYGWLKIPKVNPDRSLRFGQVGIQYITSIKCNSFYLTIVVEEFEHVETSGKYWYKVMIGQDGGFQDVILAHTYIEAKEQVHYIGDAQRFAITEMQRFFQRFISSLGHIHCWEEK